MKGKRKTEGEEKKPRKKKMILEKFLASRQIKKVKIKTSLKKMTFSTKNLRCP